MVDKKQGAEMRAVGGGKFVRLKREKTECGETLTAPARAAHRR